VDAAQPYATQNLHGGLGVKSYWHLHPETVDRLAADYCLGTMPTLAKLRFEALLANRPDMRRQVDAWHERLSGLLVAAQPVEVRPEQWQQLEARLFGSDARSLPPSPAKHPWWKQWFSPIAASAMAMGLVLGVLLVPLWESMHAPVLSTQLPESYVGVLATTEGKPGLIVSSLRKSRAVDLKQLSAISIEADQTLFLWAIDKNGTVQPIGPIPNGNFVSAPLPQIAETLFFNAEQLAVSVEQRGSIVNQPGSPWVYRGLCGKLWKPPVTSPSPAKTE
jgi:anti-sigma-K factor RskA